MNTFLQVAPILLSMHLTTKTTPKQQRPSRLSTNQRAAPRSRQSECPLFPTRRFETGLFYIRKGIWRGHSITCRTIYKEHSYEGQL